MNASGSLEETLRALLDRASITDLIYDFGRCIDDNDAAGYAANFTDDALLILPFAEVRGRDNILAMPGPPAGWATHHHLSNVTVEVSGDRATSRAYVIATHVFDIERPSVKAQAGGWYRHELRRSADGWLFERVELEVVWESDEPMVPHDVQLA